MHSFGSENYNDVVQVHLREKITISESVSALLFGKQKPLPIHIVPRALRIRFGDGTVDAIN